MIQVRLSAKETMPNYRITKCCNFCKNVLKSNGKFLCIAQDKNGYKTNPYCLCDNFKE